MPREIDIFDLAVRSNQLPENIADLVPLSFIGQKAVNFYRQKIELIDKLDMSQEQRAITLRDGQDAGKMLLRIEARIGELLPKQGEHLKTYPREKGRTVRPSITTQEGLSMSQRQKEAASAIARNPKIVTEVEREAVENEDIPTKTAVLNKIKYEKEKARREKYEEKITQQQSRNDVAARGEAVKYLSRLREIVLILPASVPSEGWTDGSYAEAQAMVEIIRRRIAVWK